MNEETVLPPPRTLVARRWSEDEEEEVKLASWPMLPALERKDPPGLAGRRGPARRLASAASATSLSAPSFGSSG